MKTEKGAEISALLSEINYNLDNRLKCSFKDSDLTMPQINALKLLYVHKEMKLTELSQAMKLANSTVSGIVDRLEKQGMVERIRSSEDRRVVYLKATAKTEALKNHIHSASKEYLASLVSSGTDEELEIILKGLKVLKDILDR